MFLANPGVVVLCVSVVPSRPRGNVYLPVKTRHCAEGASLDGEDVELLCP